MSRLVSGIKPTGNAHLGNYVGMLRPGLELAERHESYVFIADLHALTTTPDRGHLERAVRETATVLLAVGFDPERVTLFRQSDIPEIPQLAWILSCLTPLGTLERAHAYKDARASDESVNHGLFSYPVLMAADILAFGAEVVPVGSDQKQHLEIARDLAGRFNHRYGDTFVRPRAIIRKGPATLPGLDGRKMSKQYGNSIPLVGSPETIRKRVAQIVTDSTPRTAPKDPDTSTVYAIFSEFATAEERARMAEELRSGALGWNAAKEQLTDVLIRELRPIRERYATIRSRPGRIEAVLSAGAERARNRSQDTMEKIRRAVGLEADSPAPVR